MPINLWKLLLKTLFNIIHIFDDFSNCSESFHRHIFADSEKIRETHENESCQVITNNKRTLKQKLKTLCLIGF